MSPSDRCALFLTVQSDFDYARSARSRTPLEFFLSELCEPLEGTLMPEKKFKVSLKPIGVAILQAEKQLKSIKQKVGREHQRKLTLHIKALNRALGDVKALCKKFTSTYPS